MTVTQNSTLEREGRTVAYNEEGEGPVSLVLVSGRDLDRDGLAVIQHYLAEEAGFRVVRIGGVPASGGTGDVIAVLDRLGLGSSWVGGHGSGGTVARAVAVEHADRVNGLLLLGVEESDAPLAPAIPVLIIQGADDDITPPANGFALQSLAPERSSVKTLDGADHYFPATHPIDAATIIEEYLDWD